MLPTGGIPVQDTTIMTQPENEPATDDRPDTPDGVAVGFRWRPGRLGVRLLIGAAVACLVATVAIIANRDRLEPLVIPAPKIAAESLFDEMIAQIRRDESEVLHVTDFKVDDAMCQKLRGIDSLQHVILDRGVITDKGVAAIASLPNLQHVRLRLSPVTDSGLRELTKCKKLWLVNLPHSRVTAAGIAELESLPKLRQLRLGTDAEGTEICRSIAKLTSLRGIHLIGVGVTDEGMKLIADMPHLESLYLDDSAVTDTGWSWVFSTKPHLHVHIDQQHHDRDPHAHRHQN